MSSPLHGIFSILPAIFLLEITSNLGVSIFYFSHATDQLNPRFAKQLVSQLGVDAFFLRNVRKNPEKIPGAFVDKSVGDFLLERKRKKKKNKASGELG